MKTKSMVVLAALSAWVLTGCGDSTSTTKPEAAKTPEAAVAPSAADELKKAAADVTKSITTDAKDKATEVASAAQKEGEAAYQAASSQITSSFQSSSDSVLKNIGTDLGAKVAKLGESLKTNEAAKAQLTSAVKSLLGNNDAQAVSGFGGVSENSKLTGEQSALAKDVYNTAAAVAMQRNLSSLDGMDTDVSR